MAPFSKLLCAATLQSVESPTRFIWFCTSSPSPMHIDSKICVRQSFQLFSIPTNICKWISYILTFVQHVNVSFRADALRIYCVLFLPQAWYSIRRQPGSNNNRIANITSHLVHRMCALALYRPETERDGLQSTVNALARSDHICITLPRRLHLTLLHTCTSVAVHPSGALAR